MHAKIIRMYTQLITLYDIFIVIIKQYIQTSSNYDISFCSTRVTMNRQFSAWFKCIKQTLRLCIQTFVQVKIHSQSWTRLSFFRYFVQ